MKYSSGLNHNIIHTLHLLVGLWFIYIGFNRITDKTINNVHYIILLIVGIILVIYQSYLWYLYPDKKYQFNVPGFLIHLSHIINGIILILIGSKIIDINKAASLYFIIAGSMAGLYHLHLMLLY